MPDTKKFDLAVGAILRTASVPETARDLAAFHRAVPGLEEVEMRLVTASELEDCRFRLPRHPQTEGLTLLLMTTDDRISPDWIMRRVYRSHRLKIAVIVAQGPGLRLYYCEMGRTLNEARAPYNGRPEHFQYVTFRKAV